MTDAEKLKALIQICKELISSQGLVGLHSNDFQALRDFLKENE